MWAVQRQHCFKLELVWSNGGGGHVERDAAVLNEKSFGVGGGILQVTGVMIGKDFDFGGYLLIASF